jgi:hypothetical protein
VSAAQPTRTGPASRSARQTGRPCLLRASTGFNRATARLKLFRKAADYAALQLALAGLDGAADRGEQRSQLTCFLQQTNEEDGYALDQ